MQQIAAKYKGQDLMHSEDERSDPAVMPSFTLRPPSPNLSVAMSAEAGWCMLLKCCVSSGYILPMQPELDG